MIRAQLVEISNGVEETALGWCSIPVVPINFPPRLPNMPPEHQPNAMPVPLRVGSVDFLVVGYRWAVAFLDQVSKADLPEATLQVLLMRPQPALAGLVRAPAGALDRLPGAGRKN